MVQIRRASRPPQLAPHADLFTTGTHGVRTQVSGDGQNSRCRHEWCGYFRLSACQAPVADFEPLAQTSCRKPRRTITGLAWSGLVWSGLVGSVTEGCTHWERHEHAGRAELSKPWCSPGGGGPEMCSSKSASELPQVMRYRNRSHSLPSRRYVRSEIYPSPSWIHLPYSRQATDRR